MPCPPRLTLPPCEGEKACQPEPVARAGEEPPTAPLPGRMPCPPRFTPPVCIGPRAPDVPALNGRLEAEAGLCVAERCKEVLPRFAPNPDCGRFAAPELAKEREAGPRDPAVARLGELKKCCELGGALRYVEGLAALPVGL